MSTNIEDVSSKELVDEIVRVKNNISENEDNDAVNFVFVTDMHIDTSDGKDNYPLVLDTLKYARFIADTSDKIDFLVLGGDCITGWFDKERAIKGITAVVDSTVQCQKPVVSAVGNHDNNRNPSTIGKPLEQLSKLELKNILLKPFEDCGYVYDKEADDGLYYYLDLPEKNTRVICLDAHNSDEMLKKQAKWLAQNALSVKSEEWKYVIILHLPLDDEYAVDGLPSLSKDMGNILKAVNHRTTAVCSFGEYDFSDYKSHIISCSSGHCHNSIVEFNPEYGFFVSITGCASTKDKGVFKDKSADDSPEGDRVEMSNRQKNRYLFDVFSVSEKSFTRYRFGNGADKTVEK